jgi:hypothetical protein
MRQLGPAGIRANIIHLNAVIQQRTQHLNEAIAQMNFWLNQISKELNAQDNIQDNHTPR